MDYNKLAVQFEEEVQLQKAKDNFLKARNILSDKQNTTNALREKTNLESRELNTISNAFTSFTLSGDLDAFMKAIKDTQYFGKR